MTSKIENYFMNIYNEMKAEGYNEFNCQSVALDYTAKQFGITKPTKIAELLVDMSDIFREEPALWIDRAGFMHKF